MTYIKQNVNFILIFATLALAALIVGSTVFFNTNLQKIANDLSETEQQADNLKQSLDIETAKLSDVEDTLENQQKRESDLTTQYKEVKLSKDKLQEQKDSVQKQVDDAESKIKQLQGNTLTCISDNKQLREESQSITSEISRIQAKTQTLVNKKNSCEGP